MKGEEYRALREEMSTGFQILSQYQLTTIIATGAILSVALSSTKSSPWLVLAPLTVIVPLAFNYASRSEAFIRIGTYIQVFHEGSGSGWETRLYQIAPQLGRWGFATKLNRFLYTFTFPGLGLLCVVLFAFQPSVPWPLRLGVGLAMIVVLVTAEHRLLTAPSRRATYLQLWTEALSREREAEKAPNAPSTYSGSAHTPATGT